MADRDNSGWDIIVDALTSEWGIVILTLVAVGVVWCLGWYPDIWPTRY